MKILKKCFIFIVKELILVCRPNNIFQVFTLYQFSRFICLIWNTSFKLLYLIYLHCYRTCLAVSSPWGSHGQISLTCGCTINFLLLWITLSTLKMWCLGSWQLIDLNHDILVRFWIPLKKRHLKRFIKVTLTIVQIVEFNTDFTWLIK